jgi:PAS domain S-box-containing protein
VLLFAGGIALGDATHAAGVIAAAVLAALFAGLTWVGALAFAGRRAPLWILPAAFAFGVARGLLAVFAGPAAGDFVALLYEPAALLAAAFIVWRAELLQDETVLRVAVTASLGGIAVLECLDALAPVVPGLPDTSPGWFVLVPVAASLQLAAMWLWMSQRELRLQHAEEGQRKLEDAVARERRTVDLLRHKESWLFDFFETAPDLLIVLAPETCEILRCNRRFSETLGCPRRDLVGRSLLELLDPRTTEAVAPILSSRRRRIRNLMLHLVRQDGSDLAVLANLALRETEGGEREVRGVLHDVTRLEQRAQIGAAGDLARVLAEASPAGLFHADAAGRCTFVNPTFCELTGLTPRGASEQSWLECVHPDDRGEIERAWQRAVEREAPFRAEHRIQPSMGSPFRVVTECAPVSEAPVGGFAGSITRLTDAAQPAPEHGAARRRSSASSSDFG